MFKPCAGFEVINGPEDFLVFTEPSRKNRQRRQHFPAAKPNKWCVGFPAKFVLTSDIILLLNNYKKPKATKIANFPRLLILKMFTRSWNYQNGA